MPQTLPIVAQYAEDLYYGNFRSNTDFFQLQDFVFHCGNAITALYQAEFREKYQELRSERKEEVVGFSTDWLNESDVKITLKDGKTYADIDFNVMSFPYDKQNSGYQNVFIIKQGKWITAKRSSINEIWQYQFLPNTDDIFFYPTKGKLNFFNKGILSLSQADVKVFYVPSVSDDMLVPDGIIETVIVNTVAMMKQIQNGNVIKKSIDGNQNKTLQTEVDKLQLK